MCALVVVRCLSLAVGCWLFVVVVCLMLVRFVSVCGLLSSFVFVVSRSCVWFARCCCLLFDVWCLLW